MRLSELRVARNVFREYVINLLSVPAINPPAFRPSLFREINERTFALTCNRKKEITLVNIQISWLFAWLLS